MFAVLARVRVAQAPAPVAYYVVATACERTHSAEGSQPASQLFHFPPRCPDSAGGGGGNRSRN